MENNYRSCDGRLQLLQKKNKFLFDVELWLLSSKVNRNNWHYMNIAEHKDDFCGTPILVAYVDNGQTVGDGHNMKIVIDPKTGEEKASFTDATAERICGSMSEDPNDMRVETVDGVEWIVGKGTLWKWYAQELVEKIEKDAEEGREMSLSIETLVTKSRMAGDIEEELEYEILGTTLLGDNVMPAVEDARIVALSELANGFNELKLRAASYINGSEEEKEEDGEPEGTEDKPQKPETNFNKGEANRMKTLSKKQLAELASKFDGYDVLAAGQDDNGTHICLMSAQGDTYGYTLADGEDFIAPNKFIKINAQSHFEFGEDCVIAVDSYELTDKLSAEVIKANAENERLASELSTANDTIKAMTASEIARRTKACKAKAVETLNSFNANRECKVSEDILADVNKCIECGEFSECEDCNGEWCGEAMVEKEVLAKCAAQVMEMDKDTANRNNNCYIWQGISRKDGTEEGVAGILNHFGIN